MSKSKIYKRTEEDRTEARGRTKTFHLINKTVSQGEAKKSLAVDDKRMRGT